MNTRFFSGSLQRCAIFVGIAGGSLLLGLPVIAQTTPPTRPAAQCSPVSGNESTSQSSSAGAGTSIDQTELIESDVAASSNRSDPRSVNNEIQADDRTTQSTYNPNARAEVERSTETRVNRSLSIDPRTIPTERSQLPQPTGGSSRERLTAAQEARENTRSSISQVTTSDQVVIYSSTPSTVAPGACVPVDGNSQNRQTPGQGSLDSDTANPTLQETPAPGQMLPRSNPSTNQ